MASSHLLFGQLRSMISRYIKYQTSHGLSLRHVLLNKNESWGFPLVSLSFCRRWWCITAMMVLLGRGSAVLSFLYATALWPQDPCHDFIAHVLPRWKDAEIDISWFFLISDHLDMDLRSCSMTCRRSPVMRFASTAPASRLLALGCRLWRKLINPWKLSYCSTM